MAEQDLIQAARGVVDAFNASDWERCKTAFARNSLYDEAWNVAAHGGSRRHHPMLADLEGSHAGRQG